MVSHASERENNLLREVATRIASQRMSAWEATTRIASRRFQWSSPLDKLFETLSEMNPETKYKLILVIRDSQVLAKLGVVTIFFTGWGQTARLQRVRQNTADRIQTETEQQQTSRLQRVRQNTADRILKFDKRYKAFEIAGYFQKYREIIG